MNVVIASTNWADTNCKVSKSCTYQSQTLLDGQTEGDVHKRV